MKVVALKDGTELPKICPHCGGDRMIPEKDRHGNFASCLYCGYEFNPRILTEEELQTEEMKMEGHHQPRYKSIRL